MKIVISQPMFFPWIGIFQQMRLADIFVHYDDVQLPLGRSFISRVQIKAYSGIQWLTVPIKRKSFQIINNVLIDHTKNWRKKHFKSLETNYKKAPYFHDMISLVENVYSFPFKFLSELNIYATENIAKYLNLTPNFLKSSELKKESSSSKKILDIVNELRGTIYITGHGAKNYLDHKLFDKNNIHVDYISYNLTPFPQLHGTFTPYVSILDLIANVGGNASSWLNATTINWKDFIDGSKSSL
jgi:hypothetical protein